MSVANFPDFQNLELDDRQEYEELTSQLEPVSDISFSTLQIWWNFEKKLAISNLLGNVVINYYQPFDAENSGMTLAGDEKVNEAAEHLMDYLASTGSPRKLIHVPEFTAKELDQEKFDLVEEPDYNEYVLDTEALCKLEGGDFSRLRRKVNRFLRESEGKEISVTKLNLADPTVQESVFESIKHWEEKSGKDNDPEHTEHAAIQNTLRFVSEFGIENLCIYVDGQLGAVAFYEPTADGQYYIVHHLKVDYEHMHIFEYMTHQLALKAQENHVPFLNYEMDLGLPSLRQFKQGLRPVRYFKKFTVYPKGESPNVENISE
jgi:hypothetical protein